VYLYLLSNPLTNIAGVYKIVDPRICFDTGLSMKEVTSAMRKFEEAGKAFRMDEYIVIPSAPKHQKWESAPKLKEGIIKILMEIGVENLVKLEKFRYRFDLKIVFDRLSLAYPYPQEHEEKKENQSAQSVLDVAANTGFFLDEEDARKLLEITEPEWLGRDHSFISFVAMKVRENKRYNKKSAEEQRRIFRKLIFDAGNYRQEYPGWRDEQERLDREQAIRAEREAEKERIENNPPAICQCGTKLGKDQFCPACGGHYCLDKLNSEWVYHPKPPDHIVKMFGRLPKGKEE
jgi:hypothetical protein